MIPVRPRRSRCGLDERDLDECCVNISAPRGDELKVNTCASTLLRTRNYLVSDAVNGGPRPSAVIRATGTESSAG